jgi:N4-gp56 family major capsid protein
MFRLRQLIDAQEAIGKNRGNTWLFDKKKNVATQGGTLVETNTMPETQFTVVQGSGTITEYGNSIPFTLKAQTLDQIEIDSLTEQSLRDDLVKVLESAAGSQFVATDYTAVCVSTASVVFTTNGTATATATADLTAANVRSIVDYMRKALIPKYDGMNYVCVASISSLAGLHADTATNGWIDLQKYTGEFAKNPMNGEVGTFYMTRFMEETGYLSNTIGNGATRGQSVFMGADAVYEAVSIPEEIRVKNSIDYDRDLGIAWYALLGFKIVWNYAADGEQHIVFATSA